MKKNYILIFAALLVVFAAGCQKDMHRISSFRVMTTGFDDPQAKMHLTIGAGALSHLGYDNGDQILVNGSEFTLRKSGSNWYADATNGEDVEADRFYCIYSNPDMAMEGEGSTYTMTQTVSSRIVSGDGVVLAGSTEDSLLTLNPACCIIRFPAGGTTMSYVHVGFSKVGNTTYSAIPLRGSISINNAGVATITPSAYLAAVTTNDNGNFYEMVPDDSGNDYFVAVPIPTTAGVSTQLFFKWQYDGDAIVYKYKTSGQVDLQRGKVYTIGTTRVSPFQTDGSSKSYFRINGERNNCYVRFSPGNLQCLPFNSYQWRFAPNQYTICGQNNNYVSEYGDNTRWIDLFAWAGTGYNGYYPDEYLPTGTFYSADVDISGTNNEWGFYKSGSIYYGENTSGATWRTLTRTEWNYLLSSRTNAASKWGLATVGTVNGLVLIPDGIQEDGGIAAVWTDPFQGDSKQFTPGSASGYGTNQYSLDDWAQMESAGAIFLPAGGYRDENVTYNYSGSGYSAIEGHYWTTTGDAGGTNAFEMSFQIFMGSWCADADAANLRRYGCAVRLVRAK